MKLKFFSIVILSLLLLFFSSCSENVDSIKLIPIKSGDKWGYIDRQGKIQINPQFEEAAIFCEGLALVKNSGGKYGFISDDGKYAINPLYKDATDFHEGLAIVVTENGKPQYIDKKGNVKITINNVDRCGVFNEDFAVVETKSKWGYIDKNGTIVIPAIYDYCGCFKEGLARVMVKDKDGKQNWGYINAKGQIAINYQFKAAYDFKEGNAVVFDGTKYGYIGKDGKYSINPQFDEAEAFENGLAIIKQGKDYGYIDEKGKIQINPQFNLATNFANDIAVVQNSDKQMGYIDKNAKYVINPQFEYASRFYGDFAFVQSSGKFGLIGRDGKFIVNPQFDDISVPNPEYNLRRLVNSDFFDVDGIAQNVTQDFTNNSFKGLTVNSTFSDLKKIYPNLTDNQINNSQVSIQEKTNLSTTANVEALKYDFSTALYTTEPIYKTVQVRDYYGYHNDKQFDHYDKVFHNDATVSSLSFNIELEGSGYGKAGLLADEIQKELLDKTKCKLIGKNLELSKSSYDGNFFLCNDDILIICDYTKNVVVLAVVVNKTTINYAKDAIAKLPKNSNSSDLSADTTTAAPAPAPAAY